MSRVANPTTTDTLFVMQLIRVGAQRRSNACGVDGGRGAIQYIIRETLFDFVVRVVESID